MTQDKTHHVLSNDEGAKELRSLIVGLQRSNARGFFVRRVDGATKNKNVLQKDCIGQGRGSLDQCKKLHEKINMF